MDQKKTAPLLGKEGPFGEASESSPQKGGAEGMVRAIPVTTSGIVGSLSIFVMRDPDPMVFSGALSGSDRYLNLFLEGDEWGALFFDVLGCPDVSDVPRLPNEDTTEWQERYNLKFEQAIPDYSMLSRISDMYIYVCYKPEEIKQLRDECLKVQASTSNEKALVGLAKLLSACDGASKLGSGLLFAPD